MGEETNHNCIHEKDFKEQKKEITDIHNELKEGNKLFKFLVDELKIVKDAIGAKNKENGDRDKQLNEIRQRANEIGNKAEQKDETLYNMVTDLRVDMATVKTALELKKKKKDDNTKLKHILYGAIAGGIITFIFIFAVEIIKYYTTFL